MNKFSISWTSPSQLHLPDLTNFSLQHFWVLCLYLVVQVHVLRQYLELKLVRLLWVNSLLLDQISLLGQLLHVRVTESQVLSLVNAFYQLL